jgi:hypothetical protein
MLQAKVLDFQEFKIWALIKQKQDSMETNGQPARI